MACGGTITDSSVYISPPDLDLDGYYDFNLNCLWNIKVAANSTILYQILDMDIEWSADCSNDYLRVSAAIN